ncbi:MAG: PTS sugar transporter subunit IIA [Enterococcus lacertideformus]|uniref:PTS sugar transporter subunit IIA n=1 Tax=Enterococcus lacertideformus TaxID=2771493 RepID=A0A931AT80_9ENTE|nr:PTS sugar transporter subunit IIA [Enterococcus lacertideformus]
MKDDWIQYYSPLLLASKNEVYEWLANRLYPQGVNKKAGIYQALLAREAVGNIEIDEGVILPHIENKLVTKTCMMILPLKNRILKWSNEISQVELIIAVFLAPNESLKIKHQLAVCMRCLANEQEIKALKEGKKLEIEI